MIRINIPELDRAGYRVEVSKNEIVVYSKNCDVALTEAIKDATKLAGLGEMQREDILIRVGQYQLWNIITR